MATTAAALLAAVQSFPWAQWSKDRLGPGYTAVYRDLVVKSGKAQAAALDRDWNPNDPFVSRFMTDYVGERIVSLEQTSRDNVTKLIRRLLDESPGLNSTELGKLVFDTVTDQFNDYARWRANTIARTETAIAVNHGTVLGISQAGGEYVDVFDGDDDEVCAAANGATWTIDDALANPTGHPNCVRAFAPHISE